MPHSHIKVFQLTMLAKVLAETSFNHVVMWVKTPQNILAPSHKVPLAAELPSRVPSYHGKETSHSHYALFEFLTFNIHEHIIKWLFWATNFGATNLICLNSNWKMLLLVFSLRVEISLTRAIAEIAPFTGLSFLNDHLSSWLPNINPFQNVLSWKFLK